jgi:hypothetical protein
VCLGDYILINPEEFAIFKDPDGTITSFGKCRDLDAQYKLLVGDALTCDSLVTSSQGAGCRW